MKPKFVYTVKQDKLKRTQDRVGLDEIKNIVTLETVRKILIYRCKFIYNIPRSIWRILKINKFHPNHATLIPNLSKRDYEYLLKFCHWALYNLRQDPFFKKYYLQMRLHLTIIVISINTICVIGQKLIL